MRLFRQDGSDYGAALRPDFNLDYLLSFPRGLSANWVFRREALLALGGFAEDAGEIIELDAILRLINQQGGVGLGHVAEPLVLSDAPVLNDSAAERAAVLRHVQARGYEHAQVQAVRPGQYRVDYGHVEQPLVSVVVIVQDQMAAAQRCVMSLLEHTRYPHYEILLIDNASEQDATREWLQSVEGMGSERLKVLRTPERLTESDLCNQAALNAQGEYLLLARRGGGAGCRLAGCPDEPRAAPRGGGGRAEAGGFRRQDYPCGSGPRLTRSGIKPICW
ncbi:glycosyltransferase [Halopseudomonas pachastrellae]|nr:glycosyltransferase [Halopseudomonas pachastrellae]